MFFCFCRFCIIVKRSFAYDTPRLSVSFYLNLTTTRVGAFIRLCVFPVLVRAYFHELGGRGGISTLDARVHTLIFSEKFLKKLKNRYIPFVV